MRILFWVFWGFVFFALFAFALNNKADTTVHWFFGFEWHTSIVIVVASSFVSGLVVGVLAMVPRMWRAHRLVRRKTAPPAAPPPRAAEPGSGIQQVDVPDHPPRDGL
jgi:uncharacterized integral membrane protein